MLEVKVNMCWNTYLRYLYLSSVGIKLLLLVLFFLFVLFFYKFTDVPYNKELNLSNTKQNFPSQNLPESI